MAGPSAAPPGAGSSNTPRIPQTTQALPAGGPFIRYARRGQQQGYVATPAFAGTLTLPLVAVSGFLRGFWIKIVAAGGVNGSTTVAIAADAPWTVINQLTLRDPSGNPVYPSMSGWGLFLINLYSGQCGSEGNQDPRALPSFSGVSTGTAGTGNFTIKLYVPLAVNSSQYCAMPADDSGALPKLTIVMGTSGSVYTTAPGTLPTLTVTVQEQFLAVPSNMPDLAPFDVGASAQWLFATSAQNPPSNSYLRAQDQTVGQWVHTKIYEYRDSNNARQDFWPASDLSYYIDNFPYYSQEFSDDRYDTMYKRFGIGVAAGAFTARPTGVIVYSWRTSVQELVTDADDGEEWLVTGPSTKLELAGTWATNSNAPANLNIYTGMVFPAREGAPYGNQGAAAA
jgi:hypothetical protein